MGNLEVPGATLYYETVGSGPLLLCISGANGSLEVWKGMAQALQERFTVAIYDRRGFSRSYLNGAQDYEHRIDRDADDAALLIKHLSSEPAVIVANSSGAVMSLEILSRHPSVIRTLVCHEPPLMAAFPDKEKWFAHQKSIYDLYRKGGVYPAMEEFAKMVKMPLGDGNTGMMASFNPRNSPFIAANVMYWFEREFMYYPLHEPNYEALEASKDKLTLVNGKATPTDVVQYLGNENLSKKLGVELEFICGHHVGFAAEPKNFADELVELLKKRES